MLKQLWQWLKRKPVNVYVPVFGDVLPYHLKWEDVEYLKTVEAQGSNRVWTTEIIEAISQMRNLADKATTPDELKAYSNSIQIAKNLLLKPEYAKTIRTNADDSANSQLK